MPEHQVIAPHPGSAVPHLGTYRRVLPVSLERMYENTLDWEHLPHVHASSFESIQCVDAGPWGWRADVVAANGSALTLELLLDRSCRRWITRTVAGRNQGSEVWTHAFPIGTDRVDIVVDFFAPDVSAEARGKLGAAYAALYERLYDEDVAMMVERQQQLDQRVSGGRTGRLRIDARSALALPQQHQFNSQTFVLDQVAGELVVYPALCPHQLGPLARSELCDGVVTCPWHGYRFDVVSGECVSGQTLSFGARPVVEIEDDVVYLNDAVQQD